MKVARNKTGELVYCEVGKKLAKNQRYYCPECGKRVYLYTTKQQSQYFVHGSHHQSKGETKEHRQGKEALWKWLKQSGYQPEMEITMENREQRADVICEVQGEFIIFEYQCSPLAAKELIKRDHGYNQLGYQTLWIFGEKYYQRPLLSEVLNYCLNYHEQLGYFLIFLVDEQIILKTQIIFEGYTKRYCYQEYQLPLKNYSAEKLVMFFLANKESHKIEQYDSPDYFSNEKKQQVLLDSKNENRQFLLALYLAKVHLFELPTCCWRLPKYSLTFKTPNYIWRGYLILWLMSKKGQKVNLTECVAEVHRLAKANKIRLYPAKDDRRLEAELTLFLKDSVNKSPKL